MAKAAYRVKSVRQRIKSQMSLNDMYYAGRGVDPNKVAKAQSRKGLAQSIRGIRSAANPNVRAKLRGKLPKHLR